MAVYVDKLQHYPRVAFSDTVPEHWKHIMWCHMWADSLTELHEVARKIGLKRSWFQDKQFNPHYDLTGRMRERAIKAGAIER